jgi:GLPGLI family protein
MRTYNGKLKKFFKKLIYLFLYFLITYNYAQETNFLATYKVNFNLVNFDSLMVENKLKGRDLTIQKMVEKQLKLLKENSKNLEKLRFTLEYNRNTSKFIEVPLLHIEQRKMHLIKTMMGITDEKYYTIYNIIIREINAYGQDFLIEFPKIKWKITNTSKKIGKYTCYKATAVMKRENSKGKFDQNIIAWFTPNIPFNYGPKNYSGLPGLIVELTEGEKKSYQLVNIKNKSYNKLEIPTNGKKISLEEFKDLDKKMFENRKN